MAPSLFKKIGAVVAYATAVRAATESYQLSEEYTADNFFDKFDFFVSTYTSGDSWDDTHGYVQYRSQADAESMGLISTSNGQIYLGPDHNSTYDPAGKGRDSVRLTSKSLYNQGLMIAKFSHMPAQACGAWPAFWSFASPWLTSGEIDYYEGWNLMGYNRMAMHTNETIAGICTLTSTAIAGTVMTAECIQTDNGAGCGVQDASGVWASTTGATFAMEWTDSAIKIWSWLPSAVPSDITAGSPDPSSGNWGNPSLLVEQSNCDLASSFANQQLVFDIDFCGDTAGSPAIWGATCSAVGDSCPSYVANNPSAFADTYFMIEGIQFYEMGVATTAASSPAAAVSPSATSTSGGLLDGIGSILESTLAIIPTSLAAVPTETYSHSTGYVYATSTSTDEAGSETTVVVIVDTTICPVTASETAAVATTLPASSATPTTLTSSLTLTSTELTTSTIFSTSSSTITSCASTATSCAVGDVTTVVIAVSTTICPVTAAEASASGNASTITASVSTGVPAPGSSTATSENSPVRATPVSGQASSSSVSTLKSTLTLATSKLSSTGVVSVTDMGGALETASSSPTSEAIAWGSDSLTLAVPSATSHYSYNGTASGASSTGASSATATNSCSGMDCIVVSSNGSKTGTIGASGLALAALAGAMFLF